MNLRRGPLGQGGLLHEANPIRIGDWNPHVQSPTWASVVTKGTSLMRTASGSRKIPDIGEWNSYNGVLHRC